MKRQVVHQGCFRGTVIVVEEAGYLSLLCRKCKTEWLPSDQFRVRLPKEMRPITDKEGERI